MLNGSNLAQEVYEFAADSAQPLAPLVGEALQVIEAALDDYGDEAVSISFNGGKDCTVLLHLFAAALAKRRKGQLKPIPALYIPVPSPFPVLETFIAQCVDAYGLDLFHCALNPDDPALGATDGQAKPEGEGYEMPVCAALRERVRLPSAGAGEPPAIKEKSKGGGGGMRRGLELYQAEHPGVRAILMGTRKGDPHGAALSHRNMTDPGWPQFARVNPIINWDYAAVWGFLRSLGVAYCSLYDEGYTSLGSTYNTFRNPALLITPPRSAHPTHPPSPAPLPLFPQGDSPDTGKRPVHTPTPTSHLSPLDDSTAMADVLPPANGDVQESYRPAYELSDGSLEREGRGSGRASGLAGKAPAP